MNTATPSKEGEVAGKPDSIDDRERDAHVRSVPNKNKCTTFLRLSQMTPAQDQTTSQSFLIGDKYYTIPAKSYHALFTGSHQPRQLLVYIRRSTLAALSASPLSNLPRPHLALRWRGLVHHWPRRERFEKPKTNTKWDAGLLQLERVQERRRSINSQTAPSFKLVWHSQ